MKKKQIFLTSAMAATLSGLTGCASGDEWDDGVYADSDTQVCVDENGFRVYDFDCDDDSSAFIAGKSKKRWYYVKSGSRLPYRGDSVTDSRYGFKGSYAAAAGATFARAPNSANMTRSEAVSRGGMGSSSRSYGGGRS